MKIKKTKIFSFIILLSLSIPFVFNISNTIKAMNDDPLGVKIIDFDAGRGMIAAIDEEGQAYFCNTADYKAGHLTLEKTCSIIKDTDGEPLKNIVMVRVPDNSGEINSDILLVRNDGEVFFSGTNGNLNGELGIGNKNPINTSRGVAAQVGLNLNSYNVKDISIKTGAYMLILTENGDIYGSGAAYHGTMGTGAAPSEYTTLTKANISNVKKMQLSEVGSVIAVKEDGTVWGWGTAVFDGQTMRTEVHSPIQINDSNGNPLQNVVSVWAEHSTNAYSSNGLAYLIENNGSRTNGC